MLSIINEYFNLQVGTRIEVMILFGVGVALIITIIVLSIIKKLKDK